MIDQLDEVRSVTELAPAALNRIRVETGLSRFPIHRLAKKEPVAIDLLHAGENGEPDCRWEVTYTQKHGQPATRTASAWP